MLIPIYYLRCFGLIRLAIETTTKRLKTGQIVEGLHLSLHIKMKDFEDPQGITCFGNICVASP